MVYSCTCVCMCVYVLNFCFNAEKLDSKLKMIDSSYLNISSSSGVKSEFEYKKASGNEKIRSKIEKSIEIFEKNQRLQKLCEVCKPKFTSYIEEKNNQIQLEITLYIKYLLSQNGEKSMTNIEKTLPEISKTFLRNIYDRTKEEMNSRKSTKRKINSINIQNENKELKAEIDRVKNNILHLKPKIVDRNEQLARHTKEYLSQLRRQNILTQEVSDVEDLLDTEVVINELIDGETNLILSNLMPINNLRSIHRLKSPSTYQNLLGPLFDDIYFDENDIIVLNGCRLSFWRNPSINLDWAEINSSWEILGNMVTCLRLKALYSRFFIYHVTYVNFQNPFYIIYCYYYFYLYM